MYGGWAGIVIDHKVTTLQAGHPANDEREYYGNDQQDATFFFWGVGGATAPQWAMASSFTRFLDRTQRRTTVGRTPLDE